VHRLSRHLPERDGIFINLLMLDLLATSGKDLHRTHSDLWKDLASCTTTVATCMYGSGRARAVEN